MARLEHPCWESYPSWDAAISEGYDASRQELFDRQRRDRLDQVIEAQQQKSLAYEQWRKTSGEWRELSAKVMRRAQFTCEACLDRRATVVHHLTYAYGTLPPANLLIAVCHVCHDRFHADKSGAEDPWCPASVVAD